MKMRSFLQVVFLLLLVPLSSFAADSMDALAEEAVQANPRVDAIQRQVAALKARADSSQKWMDPVLGVEYSQFPVNTWSLGDSAMTGIQLTLKQTFPFPGKNDRREKAAEAESEVKQFEREEFIIQLTGAVKRNYLTLALVRQLKQLNAADINAIEKLEERVRLRYEVGRGNQKDLLRLELLKTKLVDEMEEFDRRDRSLTATINGALHRDVRTPIETPDKIDIDRPANSFEQLVELATENRPALAALKQKAKASRMNADQTVRERWPDITVWLGYRFRVEAGMDDGTDFMSIGASVPIPINYTKSYESQEKQYLELAGSAEQSYLAELDVIASGLAEDLAAWDRAVSKEKTYRTRLAPEAKHTLDAALLAYETDRTDFFSIYRAQLDIIQFERVVRMAQVEAAQMKIAVETLVGVPIDVADDTERGIQ
jgi:cobalt-zinc-cadmium efflux system outer membrane protein